jgi:hypothetical protein
MTEKTDPAHSASWTTLHPRDDRRLTYYCLREGQVLLASDALAWTLVRSA